MVVENAFDKLMKCKDIDQATKHGYLAQLKGINGHNNTLQCKWLEYALQLNFGSSEENKNRLTVLCGPNYEFRTRVNAANAIKRLKLCDDMMVGNLLDAALTYNGRLSGPCVDALKELKKEMANNAIIQNMIFKLSLDEQERMRKAGL